MANRYKSVIFIVFAIAAANGHPGSRENVTEEEPHSPDADAISLKDAIRETDGQRIFDIVNARTRRERLSIVDAYKNAFQPDLIRELDSAPSGNLSRIVVALITPLEDYYARELKRAVSDRKFGNIAEILGTLTDHEFLGAVKASYVTLFGNSLLDDLSDRASDHFGILITGLITVARDKSSEIDGDGILDDAWALEHSAFHPETMASVTSDQDDEKSSRRLENYFAMIFATRSLERLRRVFAIYEIAYNRSIESSIATKLREMGEIDLLEFLLVFVKCIVSTVDFLAERLYASVAGTELDDETLVRILVTRSEIDLPEILEAFDRKYEKSFRSWIEEKTTDDYQKALLSLSSRK